LGGASVCIFCLTASARPFGDPLRIVDQTAILTSLLFARAPTRDSRPPSKLSSSRYAHITSKDRNGLFCFLGIPARLCRVFACLFEFCSTVVRKDHANFFFFPLAQLHFSQKSSPLTGNRALTGPNLCRSRPRASIGCICMRDRFAINRNQFFL